MALSTFRSDHWKRTSDCAGEGSQESCCVDHHEGNQVTWATLWSPLALPCCLGNPWHLKASIHVNSMRKVVKKNSFPTESGTWVSQSLLLCPLSHLLPTLSSLAKTNRKQNEIERKGEFHVWPVFPLCLQPQMRAKRGGHWGDVGRRQPTKDERVWIRHSRKWSHGVRFSQMGQAKEESRSQKGGDKGSTNFIDVKPQTHIHPCSPHFEKCRINYLVKSP